MSQAISAKIQARLDEIDQHRKVFKQRAVDAQNCGDYKSSTDWQLNMLELNIERDKIYLNFYTEQNSPNKYYWKKRLNIHTQQKEQMLEQSEPDTDVSTRALGAAGKLSKAEIEAKINSSGLRQTLTNANKAKNWDEAKRLTAIIQQFRNTGIWVDYRQPGADVTPPTILSKVEIEAKINSSGLRQALTNANKSKNWDEAKRLTAIIKKIRKTGIWIDFRSGQGQDGDQHDVDAFEKSVVNAYLRSGNEDRVHTEIIKWLAKQEKVKKLGIRDVLYDGRTSRTAYPPKGSVINAPYIRDAINIKKDGTSIDGYSIKDEIFKSKYVTWFDNKIARLNKLIGTRKKQLRGFKYVAHRDAVQLIPEDRSISRYWSQFAGAKLNNVTVKNIDIQSIGSLQGVFSSDGAINNVTIKNITVDSISHHGVQIMGMLWGTLEISNKDGTPQTFTLLPLRLGGGRNIYITGFSAGSSYQYGVISSGNSNAIIIDNRKKPRQGRGRYTYYNNFNMDKFINLFSNDPQVKRATETKNQKLFLDRIESNARRAGGG